MPAPPTDRRRLPAPAILGLAYAVGAVPYSGLAARLGFGVDLRRVGTGTVSGTGLYEVAGFGPLAGAGLLELAAGALGPALAGPARPGLGGLAAALAICGHNWSPVLRGAGGRGISTALGASLVLCPEGTAVLAAGLGGGRLARRTGLGCFLALVALFPLLGYGRGRTGLLTAACLAGPVLAKRVLGNGGPVPGPGAALRRLAFDADRRSPVRRAAAGP